MKRTVILLLVCVAFGVVTVQAGGYKLPVYPEANPEDTVAITISKNCHPPLHPYPFLGWSWSVEQGRSPDTVGGDEFFRLRRSLSITNYVDEDTSVDIGVYPQSLFHYLSYHEGKAGGYICVSPPEIAEVEIVSVMDGMPSEVESIFPYIVDDRTLEVIVISGGKRYEILIHISQNLS